jgi:hypothetical protein
MTGMQRFSRFFEISLLRSGIGDVLCGDSGFVYDGLA